MEHNLVLRGRHVALEPLRVGHAEELAATLPPVCDACTRTGIRCIHGDDVFLWTNTAPRGVDAMRRWIVDRTSDRAAGKAIAFLQRDPRTGRAMGSTSLFDWSEAERCAEIGHTWLAAPYRRTGANRESKLLLLEHGFETLKLARIQIVTDARNERSRKAIEGLGARFEGLLRRHRRGWDGNLRDSAYYSVVEEEWAALKPTLTARIL